MFLLLCAPLCAYAAIAPADTRIYAVTYQQAANSVPLSVYTLVTAPSLDRKKVETIFRSVEKEIPGLALVKKSVEKVIYRLVVQCFDKMAPAKRMQTDLLKNSKTASFIAHTDSSYCVTAGSEFTEDAARAEQKILAGKHINAGIVKLSLPLPHWQIRSNDINDLRSAVFIANSMAWNGVATTIEPVNHLSEHSARETLDRLIATDFPVAQQ